MKRIISIILTLGLLFVFAIPASADDAAPGSVTISMDSIAQLWKDQSPEMAKIKDDFQVTESTYYSLKDSSSGTS